MKTLRHFFSFSMLIVLMIPSALAGGPNGLNDNFEVKSLSPGRLEAEGDVKNLKVGDYLYFPQPPFRFQVTGIQGKKVTLASPETVTIKKGQNLLRNPTEHIKKALDTETRVKDALSE